MRVLSAFVSVIVGVSGVSMLSARDRDSPFSAATLREISRIENEIDRIESETVIALRRSPDNQVQQIELLGKLLLYDKELSVNRNEACAFCHMPEDRIHGADLRKSIEPQDPIPDRSEPDSASASPQTHSLCAAVSGASLR